MVTVGLVPLAGWTSRWIAGQLEMRTLNLDLPEMQPMVNQPKTAEHELYIYIYTYIQISIYHKQKGNLFGTILC